MKHGSVFLIILCLVLSFVQAQQKRSGGLLLDDPAYYQVPYAERLLSNLTQTKLVSAVSLKRYAPNPRDQGSYNNCVGWASAYAARTILESKNRGWTSRELINRNAFAPGFIYKLIAPGKSCYDPSSIEHALLAMQKTGAAKFATVQQACPESLSRGAYHSASKYRIRDFERLFYFKEAANEKILGVKKALAEGLPVIIGMRCTPSFEYADGYDVWRPRESKHTKNYFGHAMCIVAYDDAKYGGAFQIMNSWGKRWGNQGFIWVRYSDFANFSKYAYVMYPQRTGTYLSGRN